MANKLNQWRASKKYGAKLNMLAKIENEVFAQLEAMRRADDVLERCTRTTSGIEIQGYSNLPGCSRLEIHSMASTKQPENMITNDTFDACVINGMEQAENNSRNIADNS